MKQTSQIKSLIQSSGLVNFALGFIVLFLTCWILAIGKSIIIPFMIALFLSFIFDPVVDRLTRWKVPVAISVTLTLMLAFIIIYLLGVLIYSNVQMFVEQFPTYQEKIIRFLKDFSAQYEEWSGKPLKLESLESIDWLQTLQSSSVTTGLLAGVGTFLSLVGNIFIVIIFLAYFLTGRRNLNSKIHLAFPADRAVKISHIVDNVIGQIKKYLVAKTMLGLVSSTISIIIFYTFGLDFAIFWGFIIFLMSFIPNIGSIVSTILPVLFSIFQFGSFSPVFWMALCLIILQMVNGNIIEPRLLGKSLNLSSMVVIIFLIFWGYLWGIPGMILAVPIQVAVTLVAENVDSLKFLSVFLRARVNNK